MHVFLFLLCVSVFLVLLLSGVNSVEHWLIGSAKAACIVRPLIPKAAFPLGAQRSIFKDSKSLVCVS